jgi:tight adherence protein B
MAMTGVATVVVLGSMAGTGLSGLATWALRRDREETTPDALGILRGRLPKGNIRMIVPALIVGALSVALTGWPVAAILGALATLSILRAFQGERRGHTVSRIEAIATWTELLRDTLVASAGLAQAIVACAQVAPREVRAEASRLADRISSGVAMNSALRSFADEVDDASADLVVCALVLATDARTQRLGDLLSALAESIRDEVAMRLRVEASRASARSSVRTIVVFSIGFAVVLALIARSYLAPFHSATGQVVLVAVAGLYGAGIWLMARLVRTPPPARLLEGRSHP